MNRQQLQKQQLQQQNYIREIESRLSLIFKAYAGGEDVPPARLYRTEGFIEAGCCMGYITEVAVSKLMQRLHQQILGRRLDMAAGSGIHIPALMKRAPVYPSTK